MCQDFCLLVMALMEELVGSQHVFLSICELGVWCWLYLRMRAAGEHTGTLRNTVVGLYPLKVGCLSLTLNLGIALQGYSNRYSNSCLYLLSELKIIFLPLCCQIQPSLE